MARRKILSPGTGVALAALTVSIIGWLTTGPSRGPAAANRDPRGESGGNSANHAALIPASAALKNMDAREPGATPADIVEARNAAAAELEKSVPGVKIEFDEITGGPKSIMATGRFLSAAAGNEAAGEDHKEVVGAFIDSNAALFGHGATALATGNSRVTRDDTSAHNGMKTLVWQQELDGIPFFQTVLRANLTKHGELVTLGGNYLSDPAAATGLDAGKRAALIAEPPVAAKKAVVLAAADIDTQLEETTVAALGGPQGVERIQEFQSPAISDTRAGLAWVATGHDSARLAWDVTLMSIQRGEMFRVLVDAENGGVLVRHALTNYITNASYRVFAKASNMQPHDSPTPMSPGHATPLTTQPPLVSRELVTIDALNTTASPNGWINDGGTDTLGNNVDAHTDFDAAPNSPDLPRPTSATRNFDFAVDFASAPSAYKDAAVTQLFYLNNWVHDKLYELGFTESAGNFQTNNFGRGGLGNDAVLADAQDGSGTNNANFSTPADGSPGRMQMYVFTGPTPDIDGDLDAEIVIHEYAHGLSNRLVGGGSGISAGQTRGMGEGWSDFYGLALLSEAGDDLHGNYAAGGYATRQFSSLTQNYYFGIRRYPYSTNLLKNPLTFKDIDPTQASAHTGISRSPIVGSTADEVHNAGEVWCVALWDMRANLITKHGFTTGNTLALQLVTDGMKLCPVNPNFIQARNAIVQADLVNNAGANQNELWAAFAKRGMGASASSPSSSTNTGVVEAYDTPDSLSATPLGAIAASGQVGGSITPASQVFTLQNNGSSTLTWTAAKTQPWLTLSTTSGSLPAAASATVTATFNAAASALAAGTYADTITFTNTTSGATLTRSVGLTIEPFYNTVFSENFESGSLSSAWSITGTASHRTLVTTANTPHAGSYHLTMDSSIDSTYSRNEATLTLNLAGRQKLVLNFWFKEFNDEAHAPTTNPFTTGADFDGVAVSNDGGTTWHEIQELRTQTGAWQKISVDLDAALSSRGLTYTSNFKIRFNHYDNYTIITDGFAFDDVLIAEAFDKSLAISAADSTTEGAAAFTATLAVTPVPASDLTVSLASDKPDASVPTTVTIPAGNGSATFPITPSDDSLLDGSQTVTISASAASFPNGTKSIIVHDNETATLTLDLPDSLIEGSSPPTGLLSVDAPVDNAVTVTLASDSPSVQPPATVTIPAGATSAQFSLILVNDNQINGNRPVAITATVAGWTAATDTMTILDDEVRELTITLPVLREGDTGRSATARISGTLATDLTINTTTSDSTELTAPASVVIPAGQTSVAIPLVIVDDTEPDGAQPVRLKGTATGFPDALVSGSVEDNDAHHFSLTAITGPVLRNAPVNVAITARDVNDAAITNFSQTVSLSAATASATNIPVTPATAGSFTNGVLSINVAFADFGTGVVLTVTDSGGHSGTSNAFDIITGPLDHFAWSTIPSPQYVDAPFPATLRAVDTAGNTVTSFTSAANLSAALPDTIEILTWTAYADTTSSGEYANTKKAISNHFTNYHETTTTTTSAAALAGLLAGKQVFLIVEQETGSAATLGGIGTAWTAVLNHFVNSGGTVIACSNTTSEHLLLTNSGLLDLTPVSTPTSISVTKANETPINNGVAVPFTGAFLHTYTTTTGTVDLRTTSNEPVVISRNIGAGRVVMVGTDFYTIGTGMDRAIANAVSLATSVSSSSMPVSPAVTGNFTAGEWSGNISIPFTSTALKLRAAVGTATADSNAFAVTTAQLASGTLFTEDFESASLNPAFWKSTGTGNFRTQVTTSYTPHGGSYHMTMDTTSGSARNEATLTLNLAGQAGVILNFWAAGYGDEANGPPSSPFTGGADFDGLAISADGNTWWEVQALRSLPSTYGQFTVDLDAATAARGIAYNPSFKIRFNQYDDNSLTTDGIVIDDIAVTSTVPPSALALTVPAQVNEGAGLVNGSLTINTAPAADLVVTLDSKSPAKLAVPSTVTIPAGMTSVPVPLNIPDDTFVDGTKNIILTANAAGHQQTQAVVRVIDNDGGALALTIPAVVQENSGNVTGTVSLGMTTITPLTVTLATDPAAGITPPQTVTIPSGASSSIFNITITDDGAVNGDRTARLTATAEGWAQTSADLLVQDNENRNITLSFPPVLRETDGPKIGTVSLGGTAPSNLTILLASSDTTEATVPASVAIPAGQSSAVFVVSPQDDLLADGAQSFTISATAVNFIPTQAQGVMRDNEAHHFTFTPIGSPQLQNGPVPAIITARDAGGGIVTDCTSTVNLSANSDFGPLTVSPQTGGTFINGIWSGSVQIDALATNVVLTADDGAGHSGSSNPFDLVTGSIHGFVWNTIASPQTVDTPFSATVRAVTSTGATATGYNGIAGFVAQSSSQNPVIGSGGGTSSSVLNTYYHDFRNTTVYTAAELGGATRITAMAINVTSLSSSQTLTNLTIRLKHTALSSVSGMTSWDNTGWTTVYRASPVISATGWVTFNFTTPFDYNGTQNLQLDLSANRSSTTSVYTYVQATYSGTTAAMYGYSNSTNGDPLAWTGATPSLYSDYYRTDIRFSTLKEIPIRPEQSGSFSNGIWTGPISIPISGTGITLRAKAGTTSGTSNAFSISAPPTQPGGGTTVFAEDFESGTLNPAYWTSTGTGNFRTQVTTSYTPHGGTRHMAMDTSSGAARNEATLTVNLTGRSGVTLNFWAAGYSDEPTGPPASPFTGGADFDGLAISADGNTWWEVQGLRSLPTTYGQFTVNLDSAIASLGIAYNSSFKIRFNQYDDTSLTSDGIVIDDIVITANPISGFSITAPAQLTEGSAGSSATLTLDAAAAVDTAIALASGAPAKLAVPASVTVPAGQTTATIPLTMPDDTLVDGNRSVYISGTIPGSLPRSAPVLVIDNDTLPFSLSAPNLLAEGATGQTGRITLAAAASTTVTFNLTSSDTSELTVPATVELQPGQTGVSFPITVVNDSLIDGTQIATITAAVSGWIEETLTIQVTDNETRSLTLSVPSSVTEGGSSSGSVSISGQLPGDLTVALTASDPSQLVFPATVTIVAGQTNASYAVTAADDSATNGTRYVGLTASAANFAPSTSSVTVYDNDVHHFQFSSISVSQLSGVPFSTSITAKDVNNYSISTFSGPVALSALGDNGAVALAPPGSVNLSSGSWYGNVSCLTADNNVRLIATHAAATGSSNAFQVQQSPAIALTPAAISLTLNQGSSANRTIRITNTGGGTLNWSIPSGTASAGITSAGGAIVENETGPDSAAPPALATVLSNLNANGTMVAGLIPNRYNFTDGVSGTSINDGGNDMYDTGNILNTNLGSALTYSDNVILSSPSLGAGGQYFTRKLDGLWVFAANVAGLGYFEITGGLGADGAGSTDSTVLSLVRDGVTYRGFVKRVYNASVPSVNHLIIIEDNGTASHEASTDTNNDYHRLSGLTGVTRIYDLLYAGTAGTYIDNTATLGIMTAFIDAITLPPWFSTSTNSGALVAGASQNISVNISTANLTPGTHNRTLYVSSNDPVSPLAGIPITLTVTNNGNLAVSPATLFPAVGPRGGPFTPASRTYTLTNTGGQPFDWTVASTGTWVLVEPASGTLAPGANTTVTATIQPEASTFPSGPRSALLHFTNTTYGLGSTSRPVTLNVAPAAEMAVTPDDVFEGGGTSGDPFILQNRNYVITNPGDAPLNWTATVSEPWLSLSSTGGTIAAGGSKTVTAIIDGTTTGPGRYSGSVSFNNTNNGRGNTRRFASLVITPPVPALFTEPAFTPGTTNTIAWTVAAGADSYEIEASVHPDFSTVLATVPLAGTSHKFTGLADTLQYFYRVRAIQASAEGPIISPWSDMAGSTQDASPPAIMRITPSSTAQAILIPEGFAMDAGAGMGQVFVNGVSTGMPAGGFSWTGRPVLLEPGPNLITITANDALTPANSRTETWTVTYTGAATTDADADGLPDDWETAHGLNPADGGTGDPLDGAGGDPDHDSVGNLLEYAFGLDPSTPDAAGLPDAGLMTDSADGKQYLTLQYRRLISRAGIHYVIETAASPGSPAWDAGGAGIQEISSQPTGDGITELCTARVNPSIDTAGRKFVRLKVTAD